jgi:C4-dicarboxylate transporter, DctM subunit
MKPVEVKSPFIKSLSRFENYIALGSLFAILLISFAEILARIFFKTGVPSAAPMITHLTLVFACFGAVIAGRDGRQLGFEVAANSKGIIAVIIRGVRVFVSVSVLWALFISSFSMVLQAFDAEAMVGLLPLRVFAFAIPLAFLLLAGQFFFRELALHIPAAVAGILVGMLSSIDAVIGIFYTFAGDSPAWMFAISDFWYLITSNAAWIVVIILFASALLGVPLFIVLAGIAHIAFAATAGSVEIVPYQAYSMLTGTIIPALPLFTLAGLVLADSGAGKRLVNVVRSFFGWLRGGPAIAAVIVSAFFTTFTGASGVTILALGSLLALILCENGYDEGRSIGLLTASGAIGLLFPPSLAIIIYGSTSQVSILDLFIGGALPGALLVLAMIVAGVLIDTKRERPKFVVKEALSSLRIASGELLMPVLIIVGYFSGKLTLVETGTFAALYAIVLEVFIHKDIKLKDFYKTALKSVPITGGVLIILAAARGVSDFLVDAEIPMMLAQFAETHIPSKWVFIALLNIVLLASGCLMDIFSAILVLVPLIIPVAGVFGIHPVHLGILFLTNLSIGFLTPPVGMNLFIASYAFGKPLGKINRYVLPFLGVQIVVLLLVSYLPFFTTAFLK